MTREATRIVAFELSTHDGDFQTGDRLQFQVLRSGSLPELSISEFERLWDELPAGQQARCHDPHIGFEVHRDAVLVLRAALCFDCSNISTRSPDGHDWRVFDPSSMQAQALLKSRHRRFPSRVEQHPRNYRSAVTGRYTPPGSTTSFRRVEIRRTRRSLRLAPQSTLDVDSQASCPQSG